MRDPAATNGMRGSLRGSAGKANKLVSACAGNYCRLKGLVRQLDHEHMMEEYQMSFKSLTAPVALAAALGFGSTAFAQTMVGTQEISEADLAAVTEHCRTLAAGSDDQATSATDPGGEAGNSGNADNDSVSGTMPDTDAGTMDAAQPTTGNEGNQDNDSPDPAAAGMASDNSATATTGLEGNQDADQFSGTINMEIITLADCQAAGL